MKERSPVTRSTCVPSLRGQPPRVLALPDDDPRIAAQLRVELPVPDVDRVHARGTALQQEIREAPGRRAEIGAALPGGIDGEDVERLLELERAARDVALRRRAVLEPDRGVGIDERAGLVDARLAHHDGARHHERLRLRA
jgi:hypothetical protein